MAGSRKINLSLTLQFAAIAAVAFCIPVFFFIKDATYSQAWLLYLGSFMFLIVTIFHTLRDCRRRSRYVRTFTLVFDSHVITITGVIISCLLCFIMLSIMVPGFLGGGSVEKELTDVPAANLGGRTNGLTLKVFMAAILGNFTMGSIVGILLPFYASRRHPGSTGEEFPLKQKGTSRMDR